MAEEPAAKGAADVVETLGKVAVLAGLARVVDRSRDRGRSSGR